jgi:hypothetical protein
VIFDALFVLIGNFFDTLYSALPAWPDSATFHQDGIFAQALGLLVQFDKFLPVHDGVFPIVTILVALVVGMLAYKGIMQLISLVRGAGM